MIISEERCALAIDIGGSKLMVGLVNYDGELLHKLKIPLKPDVSPTLLVELILKNISMIKSQSEGLIIDCAGIAIPGLADPYTGVWVYSCFSGIRNFNIAGILSEELKLPVFIDNDVNVCAYGEMVFGACRNEKDFLWVTVSNGVGGGLVLNGKLYPGAFKNSGEVGHINVVENGYLCPCGNYGCLEAHASGLAIARRYYEKAENDSVCVEKGLSAKEIADLAKTGDRLAIEIYNETGYFLGKAISSAVNVINPQKVILGGGVSIDFNLFASSMRQTMDRMVFKEANKSVKIEQTALLYDAALIGAAAIAQKRGKIYG